MITTDTGEFEMPLRSGNWFLTCEAEIDGRPYGIASVTVARADLEGVHIRLVRRFTLMGVAEGSPPLNTVYLAAAGWTAGPTPTARPDRDGALRIANVIPGRYRVVVQMAPSPSYLESIYLGEQDVLARAPRPGFCEDAASVVR